MRTKSGAIALLLSAALLVAVGLTGCGKDAPKAPESYVIGEDSAATLDGVLPEDGGSLAEIQQPADSSSSGSEPVTTYTYEKMTEVSKTVRAYAEKLMGEEQGFEVLDEAGEVTELPELLPSTGTLRLAKKSSVEKHIFAIDLSWTEEGCTVTVSQPEGRIIHPVEPMTMNEAISYFRQMKPSEIGLQGETMSSYQIFPVDGIVFVDNHACIKFSIYNTTDPQLTGQVQGIYFMTGDKKYLYRLDQDTDSILQLLPKETAESTS